jgi:hypothetical protein
MEKSVFGQGGFAGNAARSPATRASGPTEFHITGFAIEPIDYAS